MITKFRVQSGIPRDGATMSVSSRIIKAAAAYTVMARMTFLRFSSCQNWDILMGIELGLVPASYSVWGYESNLELAAPHDSWKGIWLE